MSFGVGVGDILKLCEVASRVYKNCRDCTGEYKSLTSEARSLSNLLEDIGDKYDSIPESKRQQLLDAYETCVDILHELDKLLIHYNSLDTKSKRAWDRIRWDPQTSRTLRQRLTSSVVLLNGFYNSLIHDSQVLILEALGRLERDYKGGHREESMASVQRIASGAADEEDEEEEDAAWPQIIRDLEDVGITHQDAIEYRDFIVDWFVRAVNEGRLMEERVEPQSLETISRDLGSTLPDMSSPAISMPSWETPHFPPSGSSGYHSHTLQPSTSVASSLSQQYRAISAPTVTPPTASTLTNSSFEAISTLGLESWDSQVVDAQVQHPWNGHSDGSSQGRFQTQKQSQNLDVERSSFQDTRSINSTSDKSASAPNRMIIASNPPKHNTHKSPLDAELEPLNHTVSKPPAYDEFGASIEGDLTWTAQKITAAWNQRNFVAAGKHLEIQLAAVERGETTTIGGHTGQPDRRLLRHLIGVCASYSGNLVKAKTVFESVFNGIYMNGANLDDGDIAAARWLGDVCLMLHEPHNTALAWSVAFNGLIGRYGAQRDLTRAVHDELAALDRWTQSLKRVEMSFQQNIDPSDIFMNTHATDKCSLVVSVSNRIQTAKAPPSYAYETRPTAIMLSWRPMTAWGVPQNMLVAPLFDLRSWPLPWDCTFLFTDAVTMERHMMAPLHNYTTTSLGGRELPTIGLVNAKELHYVTKKSQAWLVETVKNGLRQLGIEHREQATNIVCRLSDHSHSFAYAECILIKFKKVQFRSLVGLKVSEVQWATRAVPPGGTTSFARRNVRRDTVEFSNIVKGILATAEQEEKTNALLARAPKTSGSIFTRASSEREK